MKKLKKSTGITLALLIYVSVMGAYLLPRNTEMGDMEKYLTFGASYVIVAALWFVLKKKEQIRQRNKEEERTNELKK